MARQEHDDETKEQQRSETPDPYMLTEHVVLLGGISLNAEAPSPRLILSVSGAPPYHQEEDPPLFQQVKEQLGGGTVRIYVVDSHHVVAPGDYASRLSRKILATSENLGAAAGERQAWTAPPSLLTGAPRLGPTEPLHVERGPAPEPDAPVRETDTPPVEKDDAYYDEVSKAVGRGTRSGLFGTSTKSLERHLRKLRDERQESPS